MPADSHMAFAWEMSIFVRAFRPLAEDQGQEAICVSHSGTGSDETLRMRVIHGFRGMARIAATRP
jgi:hypothetical protein